MPRSAIAAKLAAENPDNTLLQRDYSLSQERLGETCSPSTTTPAR